MKARPSGRQSTTTAAVAAAVACILAGVSCVPPVERAAGTGQALYVANALDDTISVLDSQSGRPLGPPVPAGRAPGQIVPGPAGTLLHLTVTGERGNAVTWLRRTGAGGWSARPVKLDEPVPQALAVADGGVAGVAAVVYRVPGAAGARGCRLALIDLLRGTAQRPLTICGAGELVSSVAIAGEAPDGPAGPIAYVGLWRVGQARGEAVMSNPRVVAIDVRTGATRALLRLASPPPHLVLAPGPEGGGPRLYVVEPLDFIDADFAVPSRARLLALDPMTLELARAYDLHDAPRRVAVAPDGAFAYRLTAGGTYVWRTDLRTGTDVQLVSLPSPGAGLVATDDALYVADPLGSDVWTIDRRRGRLTGSLAVGRHPVALALGPRP
jgi:hypothetical protein